jgi:hypothetical protein
MIRAISGLLVTIFAVVLGGIAPRMAAADGWAINSEQTKLAGWAITETGKVERHWKIDEHLGSTEWYDFNGRCFLPTFGYASMPEAAALLLVDQSKTIHLAILKAVSSDVEIKVHDVRWIQCPSAF